MKIKTKKSVRLDKVNCENLKFKIKMINYRKITDKETRSLF